MKRKTTCLLAFILISFTLGAQATKATLARADSLLFSGDSKAAREIYRKILTDSCQNGGAWSRYGLSNLNLKNYDEALRLFEKALLKQPPPSVRMNTYASISRAYAAKNSTAKALINLDSAVNLGYGNLNLIDTHEDYTSIRKEEQFKAIRQRIYNIANPCMTNPKAREFDFWIGDWDVYVTGTKNYAGHNKIEMISAGCALLENWDSNASSGKSLNFIDPLSGKWKQTWVGSYLNGTQEFVDGEYSHGAMRFVFESTDSRGNKTIGRFIFFNEMPGRVRQFNETSVDGGKTWLTNYDFTYIRKQ